MHMDTRQTEAALRFLKAKAPQAISRSLNRARTSGRVVLVRAIAQDMKLSQKVVKKHMGERDATPTKLVAELSGDLKRIPLINFGAKQFKRAGVKANTGRGRKSYGKTFFIATMPSGHVGVFSRTLPSTKRSPGAWSENLHIQEKRGPSVGHVFTKHMPAAQKRALEVLPKNLEREFRHVLRQGARL